MCQYASHAHNPDAMERVAVFVCLAITYVLGHYDNVTLDAVQLQLQQFKMTHPRPIGVLTTSAGKPVDVTETVGLNTDIFNNQFFWDMQTVTDRERIPERISNARGAGAFGHFVVTHDVSRYTKADVFNGIGKKTPVVARFSYSEQNLGGTDLVRESVGLAVKFYTNEGNLDLLATNFPVFFIRSPHLFNMINHAFKENPKTHIYDSSMHFDFLSRTPELIHGNIWLSSDIGISNGYRKTHAFTIHAFELVNEHGDSFFARFNFRTEQGLEFLTDEAAKALRSSDPDYATRDLYNAIDAGNFPSWRLEMDLIPKHDIPKLNYNPFDLTTLWRNGTYHTVTIGRLILNRNPNNVFSDIEQSAFNPGNLVPGIPGPQDITFKARRFAYRSAQIYRLGINHNNIDVNRPKYSKTYNRDGVPPVLDNMKDAPNYYQNSFNGPVPYVDVAKPKERLSIKFRQSIDLQEDADFYKTYVNTEGKRNRLASNMARALVTVVESVARDWLRILYLISEDLGHRTEAALPAARRHLIKQRPKLRVVEEDPRTLDLESTWH